MAIIHSSDIQERAETHLTAFCSSSHMSSSLLPSKKAGKQQCGQCPSAVVTQHRTTFKCSESDPGSDNLLLVVVLASRLPDPPSREEFESAVLRWCYKDCVAIPYFSVTHKKALQAAYAASLAGGRKRRAFGKDHRRASMLSLLRPNLAQICTAVQSRRVILC
jgi:hypothetical protein